LNDLRHHYMEMCESVKGLDYSFSCMVNKKNLGAIPEIIRWALERKGG